MSEPIQQAARTLRGDDLVNAVHDARKALKRSRAALRTFRAAFGASERSMAEALRAAGRTLGMIRDRHAKLEALDAFLARHPELEAPLDAFRTALRSSTPLDDPDERARALAVATDLDALATDVASWVATHDAGEALSLGLERAYRRARRAMREAYEEPTTDRFHAWRRRTKDVLHQWTMLRPLWPEVLDGYIRAAKSLGDDLGEEHDAALLARQILHDATLRAAASTRADCLGAIEGVRSELRARARHLGRRLFGEHPRVYVERLLRWRQAWQDESRSADGS
ncbi:MAG: CHAD domain-containing protein [Planctomycetes bacterium]|nr:CHAD domain-containing protein [Planctomycetota bacterium]MCC7172831.1 CHAD domain-containing protein [Planctomycetota bacterium]